MATSFTNHLRHRNQLCAFLVACSWPPLWGPRVALSEAGQNRLADRAATLDTPMRSSQTGRVDGSEIFGHRRVQHTSIDEVGHLVEQMVLLDHIRGLVEGAGEHELPVHG